MSLLNPGPGDLIDRLSVLQLKIIYGRERGNSVLHFEEEAEEIMRVLRGKLIGLPETVFFIAYPLELKLMAINAIIWQMIEKTRRVKRVPGNHAIKLQQFNDDRQRLVERLHKLYTGEDRSEEKLR